MLTTHSTHSLSRRQHMIENITITIRRYEGTITITYFYLLLLLLPTSIYYYYYYYLRS